jgi:hypothetical protein
VSPEPVRDDVSVRYVSNDDGLVPEGGIVLALCAGGAVYNVVCALTRADAQLDSNWTWAAIFGVVAVVVALRMIFRALRCRSRRAASRSATSSGRHVIKPIKLN